MPSSSQQVLSQSRGGTSVGLQPMSYGQPVTNSKYDSGSSSGSATLPRPGGNWDMDRAMRVGYERSVWFYRAIEAKARDAANRHIHAYKADGTFTDNYLCELLNGPEPNPVETGKSLRRRISLQLDTSPRGVFVEVTRSGSGQPARIDLLPPGRTAAIPGKAGEGVDHYELTPIGAKRGEVVKLDPEDVVWIINRHPDNPWRNMTALEVLSLTVDIDYFARLFARQFMINDGRPGGIINVKGEIEDDEADRIERKFGGGPEDAGRNVVLNVEEIQYEEVGRNGLQEAAYSQTRKDARDETMLATGVPLSVAGDASGRTFSNADAEEEGYWLHTEMPWMGLMLDPWQVFAPSGSILMHDVSDVAVLERHKADNEKRLMALFAAGAISWDELRTGLGRPTWETPWSRAIWLPGNFWLPATMDDLEPMAEMQNKHAPPPPPAAPAPPAIGDGTVPGADGQLLPPLAGNPDGHGNAALNPLGDQHPALISARWGENVPRRAITAGAKSDDDAEGH